MRGGTKQDRKVGVNAVEIKVSYFEGFKYPWYIDLESLSNLARCSSRYRFSDLAQLLLAVKHKSSSDNQENGQTTKHSKHGS